MSDRTDNQETPRGFQMNVPAETVKLGVPTCQVNRVYETGAIPGWQILGDEFIERMRKKYSFQNWPQNMGQRLEKVRQMEHMLDDLDEAETILNRMVFEHGLHSKETKPGVKKAYRIDDLTISPKQIYVRLQGPTDVALEICEQVGKELCAAAHLEWADLHQSFEYDDYSTASKVILGQGAKGLVGDPFRVFLAEDIAAGDFFGRYFVPKEIVDPQSEVTVRTSVFSLKVNVRIVDHTTGMSYRDSLVLFAEDAVEEAKGIFIVQSKLPSDRHEAMCAALTARLAAAKTK